MIFIAADHAGFALKETLKKSLPQTPWKDLGPSDTSRVDYPDFAYRLAEEVSQAPGSFGVLICGSGIGMSIAANRNRAIRAALCENPVSARLAREHNDANVLCLGARFLAPEYATEILSTFLNTPFNQDPRHAGRVRKLC